MLELCESAGLPIPEVNVAVGGMTVDALWRDQRVIVELDGKGNHGTPAQIARDHDRDLRLRALGFTVLRYAWEQLMRRPDLVLTDLRRALGLKHRPPGRAQKRLNRAGPKFCVGAVGQLLGLIGLRFHLHRRPSRRRPRAPA